MFGSDWLEDYDSEKEYEMHIGPMSFAEEYMSIKYDKPIGAPVHLDEEYDSMAEYERGIKHFRE